MNFSSARIWVGALVVAAFLLFALVYLGKTPAFEKNVTRRNNATPSRTEKKDQTRFDGLNAGNHSNYDNNLLG